MYSQERSRVPVYFRYFLQFLTFVLEKALVGPSPFAELSNLNVLALAQIQSQQQQAAQPQQQAAGTTSGLFGNTTNNSTGGGLFGNTNTSGGLFGNTR